MKKEKIKNRVIHGMAVGLLLLSFFMLSSCENDEETPDEIELFIERVISSHNNDSLSLALQNLEDANNRHYVDSLYKVFLKEKEESQVDYLIEQEVLNKTHKKHRVFITYNIINGIVSISLLTLLLYSIHARKKERKLQQKMMELEEKRLSDAVEHERLKQELLELRLQQEKEKAEQMEREKVAISMQLAGEKTITNEASIQSLTENIRTYDKDYFLRLEEKHPTLTSKEVRLISFIRIGMSSSEIAQVLNISVESLHKSRYRLRKKLGLSDKENLDNYIKKL